jgi:hypothetical protein
MRYIRPPDFKSVRELEQKYKKIEEDITTLLTADGSANTAKELNEKLSQSLNIAVTYLTTVNRIYAKKELPKAFQEGKNGVKSSVKFSAKEAADILEKQGFKYAKNGLSRDTYIELQTATQSAGNGLKTRVNSIIKDLHEKGNDSVYNVQQEIKKDLQEHGIFTVKYSNGAQQPLHAYAAMAARSARIESANIGAIGGALQAGTDLVKMTRMPQCCKLCGAYQDKVYSISGKDKRFPALFKTVLKNGYALPHPNCRHEFIPWFEDMEAPEDVEKAIRDSKIKYDSKGNLVDVRFQKDIESYQAWQAGNRQLNREYLEYEQMRKHYAGREEDMPYKTLGSFRKARRSDNLSPAFKAWRYRKLDQEQYERWKGIVGERYMPKTVDEFQQIKYNRDRQQEFEKLRQIRAQEIDYNVAETGGAHSGKLADYQKNFSIAALEKTVKNLDEKIVLHISKINTPEQHYPDWEKRDPREREGLIKHWRKEVANFQRQKNIALAELRRRRNE